MTQEVGIGELKYAKKNGISNSIRLQNKPVKVSKKNHEPDPEPSPKEGQLSVDIYQTDDRMIVACPIAGVKKSEIKVSIHDDVLTIRGERERIKDFEDKTPLVNELFWGVFSRSIVLPDHIDRKNISARVQNHILIITIPKTEDFKTRIIHINDDK
ncbi:Hsp20/alpha crystallin family protein [Patescibacteria group bacterium]|nr:Hsp20/alpha crystallin family protein [Patescibacteria group bacterium]